MIVVTTPFVPGHRVVEAKGQVFGLVVRSRGLAGNLSAALRSIVGGEITEYTELLEDTRRQALDRMVKNATLMGADAVISMRFDTGPPEARFRATEERFVDPTTRRQLRVWVDPATGERRYRDDE